MIPITLALATLASPVPPAPTPLDDLFDPLAIATEWLTAHERDPATVVPIDQILDEDFVHIDLGPFDVRIPPHAITDTGEAKQMVEVIESLVQAQVRWLDWVGDTSEENQANLQLLTKWSRALKHGDLKKCGVEPGGDLLEALAPDPEVLAAARALTASLSRGGHLGLDDKASPTMLILLPTRGDFVEFTCVVGWGEPEWRHVYWSDALVNWTHLDYAGRRLIALEFASPGAGNNFRQSIPMKSRNPKGLAEHVTQLAIRSLLETSYGDRMESLLAVALANNLVIELFDEVDTRNDGDTKARSVAATSVFVAGGSPGGGILPPASADSRWRRDKGKDFFVPVLRNAQKSGGKKARNKWDKRTHFLILDEMESEKFMAAAPFFGTTSTGNVPPDIFLTDYAEFLRAYRSAFFHWLRDYGAGNTEESHTAFSNLLHGIAHEQGDAALANAMASAYEATPLSTTKLDETSLEGQFLLWLSKQ